VALHLLLRSSRITPEGDDPAACFPPFTDYIATLRQGKEDNRMSFSRLLSSRSDRCVTLNICANGFAELTDRRTADALTNEELDKYLNVAESALGVPHMGSQKPTRKSSLFLQSNTNPK
jgi:hypothetical protein